MALPAPSPITQPSPYFVAGTRKVSSVPTIANPASPTSAELTAGTALENAINAMAGFDTPAAAQAINTLGTRFVASVPGRITPSASSITFLASLSANDVRSIFTQDQNLFIAIYPEGIVSSGKVDIWPVRVMSVSKDTNIEQEALIVVAFAITSTPSLNVAIPTV